MEVLPRISTPSASDATLLNVISLEDFLNDPPETMVERLPRRSFIAEVAHYSYGREFLASLLQNLREGRDVFFGDSEFLGHLLAAGKEQAASALSELWLAANLLRAKVEVSRLPPSGGDRIPDFLTTLLGSSVRYLIETKRHNPRGKPARDEELRKPEYLRLRDHPSVKFSSGTSPATLLESHFRVFAERSIRKSKGQFSAVSGSDAGVPRRILALDVSECTTCQALLRSDEDPSTVLEDLRANGQRELFSLLVYSIGYDRPSLFRARMFTRRTA